MVKRIGIIGGGISGLSAALTLEQKRESGVPFEYILFESSTRLGGVLVTERVDDCLIEGGPDSFLTEKPWATDLCRQLGLADQLIGSNDAERKTYLLLKGRLVALPDGLMWMVPTKVLPTVFSPLFSLRAKLGMAREWFHPPRQAGADESVAALVERHYGAEMVDRLADPLLAGVYGAEAGQLSVRAVLPRFSEMEARHGSLGRAMLSARKKPAPVTRSPVPPLFTSLKDGMQQLVEAILKRLPPSSLRTKTSVRSLEWRQDGWRVSAGYHSDHFDAVIVAVPTPAAAEILQIASPSLTRELASIHYSSSVIVTIGYDQTVRARLPPGFGFLVPRSEGKRIRACTFVHNKFPHRAPGDCALIRCFLGGTRDEEILTTSEEEILAIVGRELRETMGLDAEPRFARIYKWRGAMAQYAVGHLERLERIEYLCGQLRGLFLAGNGYRGIGVPDCIRSGADAANHALISLGLAAAQPHTPGS